MKPAQKARPFDVKAFLGTIGKGRSITRFGAGEIIFAQGDEADAVFYIQEGQVKISVLSAGGKEAVLGILGPGQFFGEGCLNGHVRQLSTATAVTDGSVLRIGRAVMARTLREQPEFAGLFLHFLLQRNARIEEDLVDQLFNSSEKRLARTLLLLANFGKEGEPELIPPINQETLAEMVGTTRSRVSSFMNKFRRLGFIEYNGGLRVHRSLLTVVLRDQNSAV
jgi:CRP-like cAMP-binding protein